MSNDLFVFGDSWANGSELTDDQKTFGEILHDKLLTNNFYNYADSSASIPRLILQFNKAINEHDLTDSIGVFFLTGIDRDLFWINSCVFDASVHDNRFESEVWFKYIHSAELAEYRINVTLLALQHLSKKYKIKDYYICGWDQVELWESIDTDRFYPTTVKDLFTDNKNDTLMDLKHSKNKYIWPNLGHPNQLGHKKIAESLYEFIVHNM